MIINYLLLSLLLSGVLSQDPDEGMQILQDLKQKAQDRLAALELSWKTYSEGFNSRQCEFSTMQQEQVNECAQRTRQSESLEVAIQGSQASVTAYGSRVKANQKRRQSLQALICQLNLNYVRWLKDQRTTTMISAGLQQSLGNGNSKSLIEMLSKGDIDISESLIEKQGECQEPTEQTLKSIKGVTDEINKNTAADMSLLQGHQIKSTSRVTKYLQQLDAEDELLNKLIQGETDKLANLADQLLVFQTSQSECQETLIHLNNIINLAIEQESSEKANYTLLRTEYTEEYNLFTDLARIYLRQIYKQK